MASKKEMEEKAKSRFGVTPRCHESGWILEDGSMLDFSDRSDGGPGGERVKDHSEIGFVIRDEGDPQGPVGEFQKKANAIRMHQSSYQDDLNIQLTDTPKTPEQWQTLRKCCRSMKPVSPSRGGNSIFYDLIPKKGEWKSDQLSILDVDHDCGPAIVKLRRMTKR